MPDPLPVKHRLTCDPFQRAAALFPVLIFHGIRCDHDQFVLIKGTNSQYFPAASVPVNPISALRRHFLDNPALSLSGMRNCSIGYRLRETHQDIRKKILRRNRRRRDRKIWFLTAFFFFFRIPARSAPSKVRSVLHIHTDASPTRKVPLLLCCGSKACCSILSQAPKYVRSRSAMSNTTPSPLWKRFSPPPPQSFQLFQIHLPRTLSLSARLFSSPGSDPCDPRSASPVCVRMPN